MTGVADAAGSIDDLAQFLGGEPDGSADNEDEGDESQLDESVGEDAESGESQEETEESESEGEEDPENQTSRTFKVTVKGDDGADVTEEVTEAELLAGYQRQKAFTQKTMELAEREKQAAAIVQQRVTEASQHAQRQAEMAKAAVMQLAGFRSEAEMAQLAQTDPTAWVQEQQRMRAVGSVLQQLEQQIATEQQKQEAAKKQAEQEQITKAWEVLSAKGIDHGKLGDIYGKVQKDYGVTPDQLSKLLEPGLVLALKDALAYRDLQAKKPQITQKAKEADRLPTQKKSLPANERRNRTLNDKFRSGKAKTNDLAAFIANNGI